MERVGRTWQRPRSRFFSLSHVHSLLVFPLLSFLLLVTLPTATGNPDAKRLYDDLLSNYNRLIRPVSNNTDRLLVKLGLRLSKIIDVVSPDSGL